MKKILEQQIHNPLWIAWAVCFCIIAGQSYYIAKLLNTNAVTLSALQQSVGLTKDALHLAGAQKEMLDQAEAQLLEMKREVIRHRLAQYIRKINPLAPADEQAAAFVSAAERYKLDLSWLVAVAQQESHFRPLVIGGAGERGIMQISRGTAPSLGLPWGKALDITHNINAGAMYLARHRDNYRGDMQQAIIRYNGGGDPLYLQRVNRHRSAFRGFTGV